MRVVQVSVWDLTDAEIDRLAADRRRREPAHADELLRFKVWRRTHAHQDRRPESERGLEFPVSH